MRVHHIKGGGGPPINVRMRKRLLLLSLLLFFISKIYERNATTNFSSFYSTSSRLSPILGVKKMSVFFILIYFSFQGIRGQGNVLRKDVRVVEAG